MTAAPTAEERAAVDGLLGPPETGWDGGVRTAADLRVARAPDEHRTLLLPALHALQGAVGWISEGALNYVCERLTVPPAEAYGVATFYAMFSVDEQPKTVVHVCDDLACRINGGRELLESCAAELGDEARVVASPCLGLCERAPAVLVQAAGGRADQTLSGQLANTDHARQAIRDESRDGGSSVRIHPRSTRTASTEGIARSRRPSKPGPTR